MRKTAKINQPKNAIANEFPFKVKVIKPIYIFNFGEILGKTFDAALRPKECLELKNGIVLHSSFVEVLNG